MPGPILLEAAWLWNAMAPDLIGPLWSYGLYGALFFQFFACDHGASMSPFEKFEKFENSGHAEDV